MKKFKRSQIENFVLRERNTDWSQVSQTYWEKTLRKVRAMRKALDAETAATRAKLKVVK